MSDNENGAEQEIYATLVEIIREPTELYKILKFENLVSGGGEAKQVISEGYVYLNGEVETRKRKKIYAGDLLSFNGQHFQIALQGQTGQYEFVEEAAQELANALPPQAENAPPENLLPENKAPEKKTSVKPAENRLAANKLRKPISF